MNYPPAPIFRPVSLVFSGPRPHKGAASNVIDSAAKLHDVGEISDVYKFPRSFFFHPYISHGRRLLESGGTRDHFHDNSTREYRQPYRSRAISAVYKLLVLLLVLLLCAFQMQGL